MRKFLLTKLRHSHSQAPAATLHLRDIFSILHFLSTAIALVIRGLAYWYRRIDAIIDHPPQIIRILLPYRRDFPETNHRSPDSVLARKRLDIHVTDCLDHKTNSQFYVVPSCDVRVSHWTERYYGGG
jgi:hypothetical protein